VRGQAIVALASIAWLTTAPPVRAAGAAPARTASVIIVRPANSPPVMVETLVRLKGELTSAGFQTEIVDAPAPAAGAPADSRAGLEQVAAQRRADAVVAIVGDLSPDSVEVWVVDKVTGKSVVRRVPFEPTAELAPKRLAIRAIELLRSSFLEIDLAAQGRQDRQGKNEPQNPPTPPPPAVVRFVEMERLALHPERFGVEVGGAAIMSLDGVGPALLPLVRFTWSLRPWFLVQAALAGLGTRPNVDTEGGSAQVAQAYGLLGGSFRFRAGERLRPFAALSAGALRTSVEGRPDVPNLGHVVDQWSFLVEASAGCQLRLPDRFYVSAAAHAQLAEPYPAVRVLGAPVATSGRPNLLLTLTIGAWL
jgi:hypothetical protein